MTTARRQRGLGGVAVAGTLVVLVLALVVGSGRLVPGDAAVLELADDLRVSAGVTVAKALTELGTLWVTGLAAAVACVVLWRAGARRAAAAMVSGYVLMLAAEQAVRSLVDRPRPGGRLVDVSTASFPSAHSAHAVTWFAVAIALGAVVRSPGARRALLAGGIVVCAAVGLTRLYLHVHFLSDVVAGLSLGAACFAAAGTVALIVGGFRHNGRRG